MVMFIRPVELRGPSYTKKTPIIAIRLCFRRHESLSKLCRGVLWDTVN